jgi:hypothetical protein
MLTIAEKIEDGEIQFASDADLAIWLDEETRLSDCSKIHKDNSIRIRKEINNRNKKNKGR